MIKSFLFLIAGVSLSLSACYYDNEEELYPKNECSTSNMKFSVDVAPLISLTCLSAGCHNANDHLGNINLEGYENIKINAMSSRFFGALRHQSGFIAMPNGRAKLTECSISKIEAWVNQGALNN